MGQNNIITLRKIINYLFEVLFGFRSAMVDSRVKMYCDEIVISDAILRRVNLEMTLLRVLLACTRKPSERFRLLMERDELRCFAGKPIMKRPMRLCQTCADIGNGFQFLRSTKNGSKKCVKCDPTAFSHYIVVLS